MSAPDEVETRRCPACSETVPAAAFCGECGAESGLPVSFWNVLLRPRVYAAEPREKVWTPAISSTLFPRLTAKRRAPFRLGMMLVVIAIVVFAGLRLNGPLSVTAAVGWPLFGLIYAWQGDVVRDIPPRIIGVVSVLGLVFGVGWWFVGARLLADSYGVSTGSAFALKGVLDVGLFLTAGGAVLMIVPAFVARLLPMESRESLDGFVIGAFGALWYAVATTATIVGPQLAEGLIEGQGAGRMLHEALSYGVVTPVVTAAVGGLIGLRLWFTPDSRTGRDPTPARRMLTLLTLVAAPGYLAVWVVDWLSLPMAVDIALKIGLAGLALLTIRCAVQIALLWEQADSASGEPELCVHCDRVVPELPFCSACGAAARASSRSSRRLRRDFPPVPV